jgi:hypothetical protein
MANKEEGGMLKGFSLTPTLTALLKPSADYLGNELRDGIKARIKEWKDQRRDENLKTHAAAVSARIETKQRGGVAEAEPSMRELAIFEQWAENVQDVDPRDQDLSAIWDGLLAAAVGGSAVSTDALNTLKTLTPTEAELLLRITGRDLPRGVGIMREVLEELFGSRSRSHVARKLEAKYLVERDHRLMFLTVLSGFVMFIFATELSNDNNIGHGGFFGKLLMMSPLFDPRWIVALTSSAATYYFYRLPSWRLSELGAELVSYAKP